jgi:hypothetical protein
MEPITMVLMALLALGSKRSFGYAQDDNMAGKGIAEKHQAIKKRP